MGSETDVPKFIYTTDGAFVSSISSKKKKIKLKKKVKNLFSSTRSKRNQSSSYLSDEADSESSVSGTASTHSLSFLSRKKSKHGKSMYKSRNVSNKRVIKGPEGRSVPTDDASVPCTTGEYSELKQKGKKKRDSFSMYCNGLARFRHKEFKEAQKDFEEAIANEENREAIAKEKEKCTREPNIHLAMTQKHHGDALSKIGKYDEAEKSYRKAVQIFQRRSSQKEDALAITMMKRGDLQMAMGKKARADMYYTVSFKLWSKQVQEKRVRADKDKGADHDARFCYLLCSTGIICVKRGDFDRAEIFFNEVISIDKNDALDDRAINIFSACANNYLGNIKYKSGMYKDAATYYETAIQLRKAMLLKNDEEDIEDPFSKEEMIGLYTNLGRSFFQQKLLKKAIQCFQKADRLLMSDEYKDESAIASNWVQMGKIRFKQKEYEDARELYNDALRLEQKILADDNNHRVLFIRHDIALTYCKEGQYDKGLEIMEDVLEKEMATVGRESLYVAKIHLDISAVHLGLSNLFKVMKSLNAATHIMDKHNLPENHSYMRQKRSLQLKAGNLLAPSTLNWKRQKQQKGS